MARAVLRVFSTLLMIAFMFAAAQNVPAQESPPVKPAEEARKWPKAEKFTIDFIDVDISTLVRFVSEISGRNFMFDEKIRGKVTIIAPQKLYADEVFNLFTSVLELKGFTIIPTPNAYKIIPTGFARQSSTKIVTRRGQVKINEAYIARLIPLKFIKSQEALVFLKPLVSRGGHLSEFGPRNTLLMVDSTLNIEKILKILDTLDIETKLVEPDIIYLKHSRAEVLSTTLNQSKHERRPQGSQAKGLAAKGAAVNIFPDERLNAIILTGNKSERKFYKKLISKLDVPSPEENNRINVYYLENANADELSAVLKSLTQPNASKAGAKSSEFTGKIVITPDSSTNSLVIMASPSDYQNIKLVIKKLDRRPKQVFVEAMIVEVSLKKALDMGIDWRASAQKNGEPVVIGGMGTIDSSTVQKIISGMAGLTIGGITSLFSFPVTQPDGSTTDLTVPGFAALLSLSEFEGVVNVLSTPHILTSDNKEAEIIVGDNVPFLSSFERQTNSPDQPLLQSIERRDVGITLRITPQISEGDYVKLDIYQEISLIVPSRQVGVVEAADLITSKRSARTSVVVKDKQMVVIGGLIQEKETITKTQVPLLGSIPIIGRLFRHDSKGKEKINLLVFLTPTIIRDFDDLDDLTREKKEQFGLSGSEMKMDLKGIKETETSKLEEPLKQSN